MVEDSRCFLAGAARRVLELLDIILRDSWLGAIARPGHCNAQFLSHRLFHGGRLEQILCACSN